MNTVLVSKKWVGVTVSTTLIVAFVALFSTVGLQAEGPQVADPVALLDKYRAVVPGDPCTPEALESEPFMTDIVEAGCWVPETSTIRSIDIRGDVALLGVDVGSGSEFRIYVRSDGGWNVTQSGSTGDPAFLDAIRASVAPLADEGYGILILDRENEARSAERATAVASSSALPVADVTSWDYAVAAEAEAMSKGVDSATGSALPVADVGSWDYAVAVEAEAMSKGVDGTTGSREEFTSPSARSSTISVVADTSAYWDEILTLPGAKPLSWSDAVSSIAVVPADTSAYWEDILARVQAESLAGSGAERSIAAVPADAGADWDWMLASEADAFGQEFAEEVPSRISTPKPSTGFNADWESMLASEAEAFGQKPFAAPRPAVRSAFPDQQFGYEDDALDGRVMVSESGTGLPNYDWATPDGYWDYVLEIEAQTASQ